MKQFLHQIKYKNNQCFTYEITFMRKIFIKLSFNISMTKGITMHLKD